MKIINGKIHIYDISIDEIREITGKDVESLEAQAAALGFLLTRLTKLREIGLLIGQQKLDLSDAERILNGNSD